MDTTTKVIDREYLKRQFKNYNDTLVKPAVENLNDRKVDKIAGKGLSKNDFTDELKTKLEDLNIESETDPIDFEHIDDIYIRGIPEEFAINSETDSGYWYFDENHEDIQSMGVIQIGSGVREISMPISVHFNSNVSGVTWSVSQEPDDIARYDLSGKVTIDQNGTVIIDNIDNVMNSYFVEGSVKFTVNAVKNNCNTGHFDVYLAYLAGR